MLRVKERAGVYLRVVSGHNKMYRRVSSCVANSYSAQTLLGIFSSANVINAKCYSKAKLDAKIGIVPFGSFAVNKPQC